MSLVGLDLNSSRARAVAGPATQEVSLLRLDGERVELAMALSLEERAPRVGYAGLALTRAKSHLAVLDFLPAVGTGQTWQAGSHRLDADAALDVAFAALARVVGRSAGVACVFPSYLDEERLVQLMRLAEKAKLPIVGSLPSALAAALGVPGLSSRAEPGLILVVDADGHALTWSIVERGGGQFRLRMAQPSPQLGRAAWLRRLLDGSAQRSVRQSRRDPRESAETEQGLYEQLLFATDQGVPRLAQLQLQGVGWFHTLMLNADEMAAMAAPLVRQAAVELESIIATAEAVGSLDAVVVTHAAAGLPGLVPLLQSRVKGRPLSGPSLAIDDDDDYGESLVRTSSLDESSLVHVIAADTPACVAHELAVRVLRGDFPRGHLESIALPGDAPRVQDDGPPRVSFRGHDHVLRAGAFVLGRDPACDLVFETELYPHVSARHAEIVYDRSAFVLCDRSRHGTLLNERPVQQRAALHSGDWIRLGPRGPVLRFLGDATDG